MGLNFILTDFTKTLSPFDKNKHLNKKQYIALNRII